MLKLSAHISALALIAALAACSPSDDASDDTAMNDDTAMSDDMAATDDADVIDDEGMNGDGAPLSLSERLANAERPDGDVELDPMRHPAEILTRSHAWILVEMCSFVFSPNLCRAFTNA